MLFTSVAIGQSNSLVLVIRHSIGNRSIRRNEPFGAPRKLPVVYSLHFVLKIASMVACINFRAKMRPYGKERMPGY